jgi:hypothetical protein
MDIEIFKRDRKRLSRVYLLQSVLVGTGRASKPDPCEVLRERESD